MTKAVTSTVHDEDINNDWAWEIDCNSDVLARVKCLETTKLSRLELYEELLELMALLELYWRGLKPERQLTTARKVRMVLHKFQALKDRMQDWAAKELRKRIKETGRIPLAEWDEVNGAG